MGARVVDEQEVAHVRLREVAVTRELIVVLAETAHHAVSPGRRLALAAHDRHVMVRVVHGGSHEVGSAGVHAEIVPVRDLLMEHAREERSGGCQEPAPELGEDGHVSHARGNEHLLKGIADAGTDGSDVTGDILRPVGDPDAAREVHEFDVHVELLVEADRQREEQAREPRVVVVRLRVAREEGMETELANAPLSQTTKGLPDLVLGHAELRFGRVADDAVGGLEGPAGVEPAADGLGQASEAALEAVHHVEAVEVHDRAHPVGDAVRLVGGVARGEHHASAAHPARLSHHELGGGGAVAAAAHVREEAEYRGRRRGLHGEVLAKALVPGEGVEKRPRARPNRSLVIDLQRSGKLRDDVLEPLCGRKRPLLHGAPS